MSEPIYPLSAFNFLVELRIRDASALGLASPLCNAEFAECDGLEMTMEPKTLREGGNNTRQIHLAGPVSYSNLSLKRGMSENLDLWRWFSLASGATRRGLKAQGTVIMRAADRTPKLRFLLSDCLPLKIKAAGLNAREGTVAIEEMQIAYSAFVIEPA